MVEVREENIVFLTITSWVGVGICGQHYYGRLRPLEGDQDFDVTYKLSKVDAKHLNGRWLSTVIAKFIGYEEGEETSRFISRETLIAKAKKQFKQYFPKAIVLVLGDRAVVEPQEILVGPKEFKTKINWLANRAEEINYWDSEEEMEELCKIWQELWPRKYT